MALPRWTSLSSAARGQSAALVFDILVFLRYIRWLILHSSKLVIRGSSWGRGFRFHWLLLSLLSLLSLALSLSLYTLYTYIHTYVYIYIYRERERYE